MANPAEFTIRPIERDDVDVLFEMLCALADNQDEREFLTTSPEKLVQTGFGDAPRWFGFIAEIGGESAGYATYTQDFHIWSGAPRITLDDIFVRPQFRGSGLGEKMMRAVFDRAASKGAYVTWTVQPGNERAISFYEKLGASYRVTGKCGWRADLQK